MTYIRDKIIFFPQSFFYIKLIEKRMRYIVITAIVRLMIDIHI